MQYIFVNLLTFLNSLLLNRLMIKKTLYISATLILLLLAIKYTTSNKSWVIKFYVDSGETRSRTLIYIKGYDMKIITNNKAYLYNSNTETISFVNQKERSFWSGKVNNFRKAVAEFKIQNDSISLCQD